MKNGESGECSERRSVVRVAVAKRALGSLQIMASGPVQKVGFTVISTSATEGVLVTTPRGTTSIAAPVTEALNEAPALFQQLLAESLEESLAMTASDVEDEGERGE